MLDPGLRGILDKDPLRSKRRCVFCVDTALGIREGLPSCQLAQNGGLSLLDRCAHPVRLGIVLRLEALLGLLDGPKLPVQAQLRGAGGAPGHRHGYARILDLPGRYSARHRVEDDSEADVALQRQAPLGGDRLGDDDLSGVLETPVGDHPGLGLPQDLVVNA